MDPNALERSFTWLTGWPWSLVKSKQTVSSSKDCKFRNCIGEILGYRKFSIIWKKLWGNWWSWHFEGNLLKEILKWGNDPHRERLLCHVGELTALEPTKSFLSRRPAYLRLLCEACTGFPIRYFVFILETTGKYFPFGLGFGCRLRNCTA